MGICCIAIVFAIAIACIPHSVSEAVSYYSGGYYYYLNGNNAVIETYDGPGGVVNIPSRLDGYSVVGIGDYAFDFKFGIVEVNIPNGVTWIGTGAFQYCLDMKKITIPSTVTEIRTYAFHMNTVEVMEFKRATPPAFGAYAFSNTNNLHTINVAAGSYNSYGNSLSGVGVNRSIIKGNGSNNNYTYVISNNKVTITRYVGSGGIVNVPSSFNGYPVTNIGEYAFDFIYGVIEVILPEGLLRIDNNAFQYCLDMKKITIPASLTEIAQYAFLINTVETIVFKGSTPPNIYYNAFINCYPSTINVLYGRRNTYANMFANAGASFNSVIFEYLPLSGYEVKYEPEKWNDGSAIQSTTNCYAYALNLQRHPTITGVTFPLPGYSGYCLQPGELALYSGLSGVDPSRNVESGGAQNVINCTKDAQAIGGVFTSVSRTAVCPAGTYKVALVIDPGWDYHWYRQNPDLTWSHKPGTTPVKNADNSNNRIFDPQTADRGGYTEFIGYYAVQPKANGMYAPRTARKQTTEEVPMKQYKENVLKTDKNNSIPSNKQFSFLEKGMNVRDVISEIGYPKEIVGSGYMIVSYSLDNGNELLVNYGATGDTIFKACTVDKNGKRTFIVE
jgi:hypothetical protein